ncbi:hypothetical protein [Fischerella sp. NIES-3754]|uniref:hypothetical protein n=1 Tax=Fischerella sp. NIES-3754 TaxID=1752063 RepID=UPI00071ED37D|nr:hypothetical protein [Fischerella sp. NIES-3754]BAU04766.1 hypothetical protein FIS3754_06550 [Fischerella sp. NIES-3754]BCX07013.1 MAG: hypothetical protein KatS3mg066_0872 [Fischerella sp.]
MRTKGISYYIILLTLHPYLKPRKARLHTPRQSLFVGNQQDRARAGFPTPHLPIAVAYFHKNSG